MEKIYVYIGNRKLDGEGGIAICEFSEESGKLTYRKNVCKDLQIHAGAICKNPKRPVLYVTDERSDYPGFPDGGGGRIFSFSVSLADGNLRFLGEVPSFGAKPSYLAVDEEGAYVLASNHGGRGSVTVTEQDAQGHFHRKVIHDESSLALFCAGADGSIEELKDLFRLDGFGPKFFQKGPHAHSVVKAPGKNFYAVCDKGGDQIYGFRIDYEQGKLRHTAMAGSPYKRTAGSAPRYGVFHPRKPWFYVNKEAEPILSFFRLEEDSSLAFQESISVLPAGVKAPPADSLVQSDLILDQEGLRLYDAMRILNRINVYGIDQESGKLCLVQSFSTDGGVRALAFSPSGRYLAAAFTEEGRVDLYKVETDGRIGERVSMIRQPSPSAILFMGE